MHGASRFPNRDETDRTLPAATIRLCRRPNPTRAASRRCGGMASESKSP